MRLLTMKPLGQTGKLRLELEDGSARKIPAWLAVDFSLHPGLELSEQQLSALEAAAAKAAAKERAVRITAASDVSVQELQRRLVRKGQSAEDAQEAAQWLQELQLLDDRRTACQLVLGAVRKGYGRSRIQNILYEKGIPHEYWEEALAQIPEMDEAIDRFLAQRFRAGAPDEKAVRRAVDALLRRGHSYADIQKGLRRVLADMEAEADTDLEDYS